jgi:DNA-directed RNA polymerase specialized sigma subunit
MSDIGKAREMIEQMRDALAEEIKDKRRKHAKYEVILALMFKEKGKRKRVKNRPPMTPSQRKEILRLAKTTDMAQHEIAAAVDVNQSQVSRVLRGKL